MDQRRSAQTRGGHFNKPAPRKMNPMLLKNPAISMACKFRHFPIDVFGRSLAAPRWLARPAASSICHRLRIMS